MDNDIQKIYEELSYSFALLPTETKRNEVAMKISELSDILNQIDPIDDITSKSKNYTNEDEYLCYLNDMVYNLENKIGNIFKSIS